MIMTILILLVLHCTWVLSACQRKACKNKLYFIHFHEIELGESGCLHSGKFGQNILTRL